MDRQSTTEFLRKHVKTEVLMRHLLGVKAAMRGYARRFGENEEQWEIAGLIPDVDREITPSPKEHPIFGAHLPREEGVPEYIVRAVLTHGNHTDIPREVSYGKDSLRCGRAFRVHSSGGSGTTQQKP